MAEIFKLLGQSQPGAVLTDLYTVPASKQTVIGKLVVCNIAAAAKTFRVSVAQDGAADASSQYLYYDTQVPANDSLELLQGICLDASDKVRVYGSDANINFSLFGDEMDA